MLAPFPPPTLFESPAGRLVASPGALYLELRYSPGRRQPGELAELLTQLGQQLLARDQRAFLGDNREMAPYTAAEKTWFVEQWLSGVVPRPAPLTGVLVLPHDVFARLSLQEMVLQAPRSTIRYLTFTDPTAAHNCLLSLA